jgi:hypothetical protein
MIPSFEQETDPLRKGRTKASLGSPPSLQRAARSEGRRGKQRVERARWLRGLRGARGLRRPSRGGPTGGLGGGRRGRAGSESEPSSCSRADSYLSHHLNQLIDLAQCCKGWMGSLLISKAQFSMKPTGAIFHTDLIQFLGGGSNL